MSDIIPETPAEEPANAQSKKTFRAPNHVLTWLAGLLAVSLIVIAMRLSYSAGYTPTGLIDSLGLGSGPLERLVETCEHNNCPTTPVTVHGTFYLINGYDTYGLDLPERPRDRNGTPIRVELSMHPYGMADFLSFEDKHGLSTRNGVEADVTGIPHYGTFHGDYLVIFISFTDVKFEDIRFGNPARCMAPAGFNRTSTCPTPTMSLSKAYELATKAGICKGLKDDSASYVTFQGKNSIYPSDTSIISSPVPPASLHLDELGWNFVIGENGCYVTQHDVIYHGWPLYEHSNPNITIYQVKAN